MRLIFETPSRSCGARVYNGREVRIISGGPWRYRKKVRRLGNRYANVFLVSPQDDVRMSFWAIEDELFIEPTPQSTTTTTAAEDATKGEA